MPDNETKPSQVGLQVAWSVYPAVSSGGALPRIAAPSRGGLALVSRAKGVSH